jgi:hypothetical protein
MSTPKRVEVRRYEHPDARARAVIPGGYDVVSRDGESDAIRGWCDRIVEGDVLRLGWREAQLDRAVVVSVSNHIHTDDELGNYVVLEAEYITEGESR